MDSSRPRPRGQQQRCLKQHSLVCRCARSAGLFYHRSHGHICSLLFGEGMESKTLITGATDTPAASSLGKARRARLLSQEPQTHLLPPLWGRHGEQDFYHRSHRHTCCLLFGGGTESKTLITGATDTPAASSLGKARRARLLSLEPWTQLLHLWARRAEQDPDYTGTPPPPPHLLPLGGRQQLECHQGTVHARHGVILEAGDAEPVSHQRHGAGVRARDLKRGT